MEQIRAQAFKIRMLEEYEQLVIKIDRLSKYIVNERAKEGSVDIELEERQLNSMLNYRDILKFRILKFMK